MMTINAHPVAKEMPPNLFWWQTLCRGFPEGTDFFGAQVYKATNRLQLGRDEIIQALQIQLKFAHRENLRANSIWGRFLNKISGAPLGYISLSALHAAHVIGLAGEQPLEGFSIYQRCLVRVDVAKVALQELQRRRVKNQASSALSVSV